MRAPSVPPIVTATTSSGCRQVSAALKPVPIGPATSCCLPWPEQPEPRWSSNSSLLQHYAIRLATPTAFRENLEAYANETLAFCADHLGGGVLRRAGGTWPDRSRAHRQTWGRRSNRSHSCELSPR